MQSLPRKQLLFCAIAWGLLGSGFMIVKNANTQSLSNQKSQEPDPVVVAVRRSGLREAARLKRHYKSTERTTGWMKYDLESLTSASSVIIIGTPLVSSSNLAGSGDRIITEFKIRIDRALKGRFKENQLVTAVVPGGKVTFEDGTSAEITTPDLGPIKEHQKYVLFMRQSHEDSEILTLTGGGQGLFELASSDLYVKPRGDKKDLVQRHKNQSVSDFIEEIETAVRKYPEAFPCCN